MSGVFSVATPSSLADSSRQWERYSAYLDTQGLIKYFGEGAQNSISTLPLAPPRQDVGNEPNEMPSALGREFAQSDFSHGQGQGYLHKRSSDPAKVLYLEGFDNSEVGILRHLRATVENVVSPAFSGATGKTVKVGGYTFVTNGTTILRFSDITSASPTSIDPHNGESATTVYDITASGSTIYAALGANGVHLSTDNGTTWSHHSDAAAILVGFLKSRLIAATAHILYEVTASGATTNMDRTTLPVGWTFTDLAETGEYVYASAVYESTDQGGQSRVFQYGLDSSLDFIEQGSSVLPDNDLCYSLKGYLGMVLLGCGRINDGNGKDALLYKAIPADGGYLPIELVAESTGAGTDDLSIKAIATSGRRFLLGWSLGADSPFDSRSGIAVYDPALDSFAHHLSIDVGGTPMSVTSIEVVAGRTLIVSGDGIFYEDLANYVSEAFLITSTGDFNNPGPKNWDRTRLSYKALPNGASVEAQYSLRRPEEGVWAAIGSATVPSSTEKSFTHANLESPRWTLKVISNATSDQSAAPEIEGYATRANQTVSETEYRIVRTFIIADRMTLGKFEIRYKDPRSVRDYIEGKYREIFDYFEADYPNGFYVRLSDYSIVEPDDTLYQLSSGDAPEDLYLVQVVLEGTKNDG